MVIPSTLKSTYLDESIKCALRWLTLAQRMQKSRVHQSVLGLLFTHNYLSLFRYPKVLFPSFSTAAALPSLNTIPKLGTPLTNSPRN